VSCIGARRPKDIPPSGDRTEFVDVIGTSFDLITAAIGEADSGDGVVLLYDLGTGYLTTVTAIEFLNPEQAARVTVVDTPFVEGAVSAAVTANMGGDRRAVVAAALQARIVNGRGRVRSVD
jgi:dihydroxyacetone kinase DhaKLM complex PTS-EIIA-like component DhaM